MGAVVAAPGLGRILSVSEATARGDALGYGHHGAMKGGARSREAAQIRGTDYRVIQPADGVIALLVGQEKKDVGV